MKLPFIWRPSLSLDSEQRLNSVLSPSLYSWVQPALPLGSEESLETVRKDSMLREKQDQQPPGVGVLITSWEGRTSYGPAKTNHSLEDGSVEGGMEMGPGARVRTQGLVQFGPSSLPHIPEVKT